MEEFYIYLNKLKRINLFDIIYLLVGVLLYIIALPILIAFSFKEKYKTSIPARFFLKNNPPFNLENSIHFHVCSFGEAKALKSVLDRLNQKVAITTITKTGYNEAKKYNADVRYLPFEIFLPFWYKKQKLLVVFEAEFWYMLVRVAKLKGAKVVFLSTRIPTKSEDKYYKMRWFYKKIFENVDVVLAQSKDDKKRLQKLGAKNIKVVGNLKLSAKIEKTKDYKKPDGFEIITAASTHKGEEEYILKAFLEYKKTNPKTKLIVVPRHPERFDEVYKLLKETNLNLSKFSEDKSLNTDIILVDIMGELINIYAITDIAILGGAFRDDVGGHNPLEPAFFGCKLISGKHHFHQKELFRYTKNVIYADKEDIVDALYKAKEAEPASYDKSLDLDEILKELKL